MTFKEKGKNNKIKIFKTPSGKGKISDFFFLKSESIHKEDKTT